MKAPPSTKPTGLAATVQATYHRFLQVKLENHWFSSRVGSAGHRKNTRSPGKLCGVGEAPTRRITRDPSSAADHPDPSFGRGSHGSSARSKECFSGTARAGLPPAFSALLEEQVQPCLKSKLGLSST